MYHFTAAISERIRLDRGGGTGKRERGRVKRKTQRRGRLTGFSEADVAIQPSPRPLQGDATLAHGLPELPYRAAHSDAAAALTNGDMV